MNEKLELLAPAGNMECLETAFYFGADAVYIGGNSFGLRAFADNFSPEELKHAFVTAHNRGKKVYVAVNTVIYESEVGDLKDYLLFLNDNGADGVIFSDTSVLKIINENNLKMPLHLSTQANVLNSKAAAFWKDQGITRVVMSREASINDIREVTKKVKALEVECFVHGSMCVAYSGRCLLSHALTKRSGNRGECAQPCRWKYALQEKGYPNDYFPIYEDKNGTYILNSKDLMMIEHLADLVEAGVSSFKIEGRMKSVYYVASTVKAYRKAIDALLLKTVDDTGLKEELEKSATRLFNTGFYFNKSNPDGIDELRTDKPRFYTFVGKVIKNISDNKILIEQRNKFCIGERLEVLSPNSNAESFIIEDIIDEDGQFVKSAPHAQQRVIINCPFSLEPGDLLRRYDV